MVVVAITAVVILVGMLYFWPRILDFMQKTVQPFLERHLGPSEWFTDLLVFVDKGISPVRRRLRDLWTQFKSVIVRNKSTFTRKEAGVYVKTTESVIRISADKGRRVVTEEDVYFDDMPAACREAIIRTGQAECDDKQLFRERVKETCAKQNIDFEELDLAV